MPGLHVRAAAQQRPALSFGHTAPHAELDPVVQRLGQTLGAHRAPHADALDLTLSGATHEKPVRIAFTACGPVPPVPRLRVHVPLVSRPPSSSDAYGRPIPV